MTDYNPNSPANGVNLSVARPQIQNNFFQANLITGFDHFAYDDTTAGGAYRGWHKQMHFPVPIAGGSEPTAAANQGILFSKLVNSVSQLFYAHNVAGSSTFFPLTGSFTAGTSGSIFLPGGIILKWGDATSDATTNPKTVTFTAAFPTACWQAYAVQGYIPGSGDTIKAITTFNPTTSTFQWNWAGSIAGKLIRWFAIGN